MLVALIMRFLKLLSWFYRYSLRLWLNAWLRFRIQVLIDLLRHRICSSYASALPHLNNFDRVDRYLMR